MIDIGANLTHFEDLDIVNILDRASTSGLKHIVITGTTIDSAYAAQALATKYEQLYFTAGCHPHHAKRWQSIHTETMDMFLRDPKCVYLGETGLDYYRMLSTNHEQEYAFRAQIELAIQYQIPLFLHERNAHVDFLRILDEYKDKLPPVIVHCFTGNIEEITHYLERGFYIGITGWLGDNIRGLDLQKAITIIPDNKLLVETDAPFLAPKGDWCKYIPHILEKHAGRTRNEPCSLPAVIQACAHFRNQSFEHIQQISTANALTLINHKKEITFKFEDVYNWD